LYAVRRLAYAVLMIGIDEVGRGCWAGPLLVVAARQVKELPSGLTDSKLLTKKQRETIYKLLITNVQFGEGWVSSDEIDRQGLASALRLGISRALENIKADVLEPIILDGSVNYVDKNFAKAKCIIDADLNIPIVSAASIYAKVTRDKLMVELAKKHLGYGFESHVGYGTKVHRLAIEQNGIIRGVHRLSFKPIKAYAG
jgi:ribonuclease HII